MKIEQRVNKLKMELENTYRFFTKNSFLDLAGQYNKEFKLRILEAIAMTIYSDVLHEFYLPKGYVIKICKYKIK